MYFFIAILIKLTMISMKSILKSGMDFETSLKKYLSDKEISELIRSFSEEEKKAVFLNENKLKAQEFLKIFPNIKPHPVVKNGYIYDKNEYELGKKIYHELGAYYIQEPSAMLVAHFLDAKPGERVLDLCAAPGGKTIQTALKMHNEGLIIANDLSKSRANILLSNVERLGISNTVVTSYNFKEFYKDFQGFFDKIILDAPCSGSGMFRKSDEMKNDWTYEKVLKNAKIQKELILMCYSMLKEGGTLAYSTCSYSFEEDEEVIEYLLNNSDATLENIPSFKGEFRSPKYKETVHLFPSHFEGEGHYIALIKKPGVLRSSKLRPVYFLKFVDGKGKFKENHFFKVPDTLDNKFTLHSLRPGLFYEIEINNKKMPTHHLSRCEDATKSIVLTKEELIKYLRGETLNKKYPNGYHFVCYMGMNVGVVYSINGILKNFYPKGLRFNASIDSSF